MKRSPLVSALALVILVLAASPLAVLAQAPPAKAPDIAGTWTGRAVIDEDGTELAITIVIGKIETGYTGKLSDSSGMVPESDLREVVFRENKLTCEFDLAQASGTTLIKFELVLEGDTLKGVWFSPDEGDSGTIEVTRQK